MKKPLEFCVNGDGRPTKLPSWVLCAECLKALGERMHALKDELWPPQKETP